MAKDSAVFVELHSSPVTTLSYLLCCHPCWMNHALPVSKVRMQPPRVVNQPLLAVRSFIKGYT